MPQRNCSKEKQLIAKTSKRVTLPLPQRIYNRVIDDHQIYRDYLETMFVECPELFPPDMQAGYTWHDILHSKKMPKIRVRRIKLKQPDGNGKDQVLTISPSFVMPYMTGYTDEVEKALFLRGFGVPYWALTYVFGHNDPYWQRHVERLGRYDLVGTTIKSSDNLSQHLLADEKHSRLNGGKVYIATTVSMDCVLGASIALKADTPHLKEAYSHFKQEAQRLKPDYQPITVNTDGWGSTIKAWLALFPQITIIRCFLHAYLSIRSRCKRLDEFPELCNKVWNIYHADNEILFYREVAELYAWAQGRFQGTAKVAIEKLCARTGEFLLAFQYPQAYRTSNMIDRHMEPMNRCLVSARYFHGHLMSAEFQIRGWSLMHNFRPYCPRSKIRKQFQSPAHKLNGFVYHNNWLHNLLISTSGQAIYAHHRKR
jgi:hypothetical protein